MQHSGIPGQNDSFAQSLGYPGISTLWGLAEPSRGQGDAPPVPPAGPAGLPQMATFRVKQGHLVMESSNPPPWAPLPDHEEPAWRTASVAPVSAAATGANEAGRGGPSDRVPERLPEPSHEMARTGVHETAAPPGIISVSQRLTQAVGQDDEQAIIRILSEPSALAQIDLEDESGSSALDHAIDRKKFRVARLLFRYGARFADDHVLHPQLLIDLLGAGEMEFAREVAGQRQIVKANGRYHLPDDHWHLQIPVFMATVAGDIELVSLLADARIFELRDALGGTALHYGVISPNPLMLASLLNRLPAGDQQRRVILNAGRTDGRTPLIQAVLANRPTAAAKLLRAGASLYAVDRKGESALHKAAREGMLEVGRLLLAANAPTELQNLEQQTPMAMARLYGRPDFVELLQVFGAQD